MAEFSKEYIEKEGWGITHDFCVSDEFKKLKEGEAINVICEGFGFTRIHRINNQCSLWFPRTKKFVLIEDLLNSN